MAKRDVVLPAEPLGGRYQLIAQVGEGTFSITYRARDLVLERTVAVKVLRSQHATDATFVARFEREARLAAAVSHPNVVDVYDAGRDRDTCYIVMEFVPGRTLKQELAARGRLPAVDSVRVVAQVLRGLAAIHAAGIVHRDVKPQNVLLGADGLAHVTDFGVAFFPSDGSLTGVGTTVGTAAYMAPEQARGGVLSEATDLYAVGVLLYELLTGRLPFVADNPMTVMVAHLEQPPPNPRAVAPAADVPPALEAELMRALAKDPAHRHPSAEDMAAALEAAVGLGGTLRFARMPPIAQRPPVPTALETTPLPAAWSTAGPTVEATGAPRGGPTAPSARAAPPFVPPPPRRRRSLAWLAPAAIFAIALAALGGLALAMGNGGFPGQQSPSPLAVLPGATVTPSPPPSPPPTARPSPSPPPPPTGTAVRIATLPPAVLPSSTALVVAPPPTPTTPPRPTVTPPPTPTATPRSTRTPRPTPTATPVPTAPATAVPTPTPRPDPTATPRPAPTAPPEPTPAIVPRDPPPGEIAFDAGQWRGGQPCDADRFGRPCVAIYGQDSDFSQATLRFDLTEVPADRLMLHLTVLGDPTGNPFSFAIAVNSNQTNPISRAFPSWDPDAGGGAAAPWTTIQISVPPALLQVGRNEIAVVSLQSGANVDLPPYLLLSDAQLTPVAGDADVDELGFIESGNPNPGQGNGNGNSGNGSGNIGKGKGKDKDKDKD